MCLCADGYTYCEAFLQLIIGERHTHREAHLTRVGRTRQHVGRSDEMTCRSVGQDDMSVGQMRRHVGQSDEMTCRSV